MPAGDRLALRGRVLRHAALIKLEIAGSSVDCPVQEHTEAALRFDIPPLAADAAGPATVLVNDADGRVLQRLAVTVVADDTRLDVERIAKAR